MENEWNIEDPLEEIYMIRHKISSEYGHDANRMFEAMIERQRESEAAGRKIVRLYSARVPARA